jgi:hypothetical protein
LRRNGSGSLFKNVATDRWWVATAIKGHNAAHLRIACLPAYAEAILPDVVHRFPVRRSIFRCICWQKWRYGMT